LNTGVVVLTSDIFVAAALDLDANERQWVPQSADVNAD
jgi:hypothetical protein